MEYSTFPQTYINEQGVDKLVGLGNVASANGGTELDLPLLLCLKSGNFCVITWGST